MRLNHRSVSLPLMLLACAAVQARSPQMVFTENQKASRGGFVAQLDADFGGDTLVTVDFEDGDEQDIDAGQGLAVSVGGWFRPMADNNFIIEALLGYKYTMTAASNADINLSRTLLQLNGLYRFPNGFYVGGGLMHHMSPKLDGDDFFYDIKFDDATGFNAEIGWRWVALHYTVIEYENEFVRNINASSLGLRITYEF
jgi:hypothetical protein